MHRAFRGCRIRAHGAGIHDGSPCGPDCGPFISWNSCESAPCPRNELQTSLVLARPFANPGTFDEQKVPMLRALVKKYGLKAGMDYINRKDEMHFEIALDAAKVAALITKLGLDGDNK